MSPGRMRAEFSRHREITSDLLKALARAMIAIAQLGQVVPLVDAAETAPDAEPDAWNGSDWRAAVHRAIEEWTAVTGALADDAIGGDLIYVSVTGGAVIPVDVNRIERLTARANRLRAVGLAYADPDDD